MCRLVEMDGNDFRQTMRSASAVSVACADCPKCGKENVYRRVGAFRKLPNSSLRVPVTCRKCGGVFHISKNALEIRKKRIEELQVEYSIDRLEWM